MRWIERNFSGALEFLLHDYVTHLSSITRLKKIQGKKKRDAGKADAEKEALEAKNFVEQGVGAAPQTEEAAEAGESSDLLGTKDEDVIF